LLDGVFVAASGSKLKISGVQFDSQFDFHFYDLDFCRTASMANLRQGTWPVALTHQSGGAFGSSEWQQKYVLYSEKWNEPAQSTENPPMRPPSTETSLPHDAVAEALKAAAEFESKDQFDYAIKVYEEILRFDGKHGESFYRLGKIAQRLNAYPQAAQYLQFAVNSASSIEKYWIGFILHLMMAQTPEVIEDAIELGKTYGLTNSTAQLLQETLNADTKSKSIKKTIICNDFSELIPKQLPSEYFSEQKIHMRFCPVCGSDVSAFLPLSAQYQKVYAQFNQAHPLDRYETLNLSSYSCPHCTASDRDRLMASYLLHDITPHKNSSSVRVLEIAPSRPLSNFLRANATEYRSADLFDPSAMDRLDITDMNTYQKERFDWVVCSHVLEHVMDDFAALSEIYRVLAPGGKALLLVPIPLDLRITDELSKSNQHLMDDESIRRFGQSDHIRMYCKSDFIQRIKSVGFHLEMVTKSLYPIGTFDLLGLVKTSCLYVAVKPKMGH
jgi:SAM-dependent methyltransferase